jgi:hypothetical protein
MIKLGGYCRSLQIVASAMFYKEKDLNSLGELEGRPKINDSFGMQGVIAPHIAMYKYEISQSLEIIKILLENGTYVSIKVGVPPSTHKISIVRKDKKSPHGKIILETKRITLGQKATLLLALELKSSFYLQGI